MRELCSRRGVVSNTAGHTGFITYVRKHPRARVQRMRNGIHACAPSVTAVIAHDLGISERKASGTPATTTLPRPTDSAASSQPVRVSVSVVCALSPPPVWPEHDHCFNSYIMNTLMVFICIYVTLIYECLMRFRCKRVCRFRRISHRMR